MIAQGQLFSVAHAITYTVTNTNDAGAGSLREAITSANVSAGDDVIDFDGTFSGTINLGSNLPVITENLNIQGETAQDDFAGPDIIISALGRDYCMKVGTGAELANIAFTMTGIRCEAGTNGLVLTSTAEDIQIGGSNANQRNEFKDATNSAISIDGASNVFIENNSIYSNDFHGIDVQNTTGITLFTNWIGLDNTGLLDDGNAGHGIYIRSGNSNVNIGKSTAGSENIISGNAGDGIVVEDEDVIVQNNWIGLDSTGTDTIANDGSGLSIKENGAYVTGNVIAGNGEAGIKIESSNNLVIENYIGLLADGSTQDPNGTQALTIAELGSNNNIGGSGDTNRFAGQGGSSIIQILGTALNGNFIKENRFYGTGSPYVEQVDPSNNSITDPSIVSQSSSYLQITGEPDAAYDLYMDGVLLSSSTFDDAGNAEVNANLSGSTIVVLSNDTAKNSSSSTALTSITADVSAPSAPVISTTETVVSTPSYNFTGTKDAYSSIFESGGEVVSIDSSTSWSALISLAEGENNLSFTSKDYSANESSASTYTITLDSISPSSPTLSYASSTTSSTITLSGTGTEANANIYLDGVDTNNNVDESGNFAFPISLSPGTNVFVLTIIDEAGNSSSSSLIQVSYSEEGSPGPIFSGGGGSGGSSGGSSSSNSNSSQSSSSSNNSTSTNEDPEESSPETSAETETETDESTTTEDSSTDTEVNTNPDNNTEEANNMEETETNTNTSSSDNTSKPANTNNTRPTYTRPIQMEPKETEVIPVRSNVPVLDNPGTNHSSDPFRSLLHEDFLSVVNLSENEEIPMGPLSILGVADRNSTVKVYEITENNEKNLLGQTKADRNRKFHFYTENGLSPNSKALHIESESGETFEVAIQTVEAKVASPSYDPNLLTNGQLIQEQRPTIKLFPEPKQIVVVTWNSAVYTQVLIADANGSPMEVRPAHDLAFNEEHTVTWYAIDPESGEKSSAEQIKFKIGNTPALITGDTQGLPAANILLIALAILGGLGVLSFTVRKPVRK